jgi:hypothetical protein
MAVKTQGTSLFFINPNTNFVVKVGAVSTISGVSASRDQIETTDLESNARTYEAGLAAPGTASFSIRFDPQNESHLALHQIFKQGKTVKWALGWSDGVTEPIVDPIITNQFVIPNSRSFLIFEGYVVDCPFDFSLNAVVESSISLQVSGFPELQPKGM